MPRQTYRKKKKKKKNDGRKVGRINWCRDECVCVGLCCFSAVHSECQAVPGTIVRRKL